MSDKAIKIISEALQQSQDKPVDKYDLLEKIEIQIDPYTLFVIDEVILKGRITIIEGLKELHESQGYAFELELEMANKVSRSRLIRKWAKRLPRIEEYLDYINSHSLWVDND